MNIAPVFIKLNQTTSFTFKASAGDQLKACFVIYDGDEVGTINYTVTPKDEAREKIEHIIDLVGNIVSASHKICDVVKCTELIAVPVSLLDKLFTIFNLGQAAAQARILGQKLATLNQAIKQFGVHSHQACVAAQAAFVANQNLHQTLLNLVPGLEFIFPLPAGGTPGCR